MTSSPDRRPARLRFSLSHLFAATTLVAVVLAGTFGPRWDADERWIIGAWFTGVLGLYAISRARGRRGVVGAALGGSHPAAAVALAIPILGAGGGGSPVRVVLVALFVFLAGGVLGVAACLAFERLASIWRTGIIDSLATFLVRWRPPPLWTGIPIGVALALAWLATSATWHHRITIEFYGSPDAAPDLPVASYVAGADPNPDVDIALTSGGTLLAAAGYEPRVARSTTTSRLTAHLTRQRLELWETTWPWPRHVGSRPLSRYPRSADFSPDGQRLAITHNDAVALWDTLSGEELRVIYPPWRPTSPPSRTWLSDAHFSDDGAGLIVRGWNSATRDGCLYAWAVESLLATSPGSQTPDPLREVSFPGFYSLHLNHGYKLFARLNIPTTRTPANTLELIDVQTSEVRRTFYYTDPGERPVFSTDDKLLAQGNRLWNLADGTELVFPGPIKQFARDGRRVVVIALDDQVRSAGQRHLIEFGRSLPIVRHMVPNPLQSRLLLFDSHSGRQIVASRPQDLIEGVTVSRNGRVVATATRKGQIRIWDVPN